ncbi:hypothetical protein X560_1294 [Listeria fleischmannii 1991]|uniref:Uncharacterized protein n=2 Tax=Listeria fleischmannii TaxID=1069827 RepID=A0A2X3H2J8_9LIST|nr:hypothetical protein [Listeria fleischmannii]EMG28492.1 hypothetical protein LFLEISCH_05175 [Listeria fleischmannii subsp. fleischmannii LU2006-1]KMT59765.1 hypothetical protein X560_1294 [Listeria fleischmannii 1991]SQC67123.1 Uncharacterised protein [Listeria fleischmannii subsp. fleischmannii]
MKKIIVKCLVALIAFGLVLGGSGEVIGLQDNKVEAATATKLYVKIPYTSQIQYSSLYVTYKANGYTYRGTVYNQSLPLCYAKSVTNYYSGWVYR